MVYSNDLFHLCIKEEYYVYGVSKVLTIISMTFRMANNIFFIISVNSYLRQKIQKIQTECLVTAIILPSWTAMAKRWNGMGKIMLRLGQLKVTVSSSLFFEWTDEKGFQSAAFLQIDFYYAKF